MLQSEILDAGTLCVASDGGWNLGKGQKVRGAAVVVIRTLVLAPLSTIVLAARVQAPNLALLDST